MGCKYRKKLQTAYHQATVLFFHSIIKFASIITTPDDSPEGDSESALQEHYKHIRVFETGGSIWLIAYISLHQSEITWASKNTL